MTADALDEKIEATKREAAELRERLAQVELKLSAYEESARLRPSVPVVANVAGPQLPAAERVAGKRGGRQPGAISQRWQVILKLIAAHHPAGATPVDIASYGGTAGLQNLKPKDAKQQADKYVKIGYMDQVGDDRYRVTETALSRYGARIADENRGSTGAEPIFNQEEAAIDSQSTAAPELLSAGRV
jgi:hypothetical protein